MRVFPPSAIDPARRAALQTIRSRIFGMAPPTMAPAALKVLKQPLIGDRLNAWHYPDINAVEVAHRTEGLRGLNLQDMDLEKRRVREQYRQSRNSKVWNASEFWPPFAAKFLFLTILFSSWCQVQAGKEEEGRGQRQKEEALMVETFIGDFCSVQVLGMSRTTIYPYSLSIYKRAHGYLGVSLSLGPGLEIIGYLPAPCLERLLLAQT